MFKGTFVCDNLVSDTRQRYAAGSYREKCCDHCLVAFIQGRINLHKSRFGALQLLKGADVSSRNKHCQRHHQLLSTPLSI